MVFQRDYDNAPMSSTSTINESLSLETLSNQLTRQQEQVFVTLEKMNQNLAAIASSSANSSSAHDSGAQQKPPAAIPLTATKNVAQNQQQTAPTLTTDVTSPQREALRAKIEVVKTIMCDLERRPSNLRINPAPPGDPSSADEELFLTWCAATDAKSYALDLDLGFGLTHETTFEFPAKDAATLGSGTPPTSSRVPSTISLSIQTHFESYQLISGPFRQSCERICFIATTILASNNWHRLQTPWKQQHQVQKAGLDKIGYACPAVSLA
ncbi:hypothetical protein EDD21DRAFT_447889 [Dissophora ornata]|nr:hypothetical protein EDD21DRAFT_447889 [Dissophora ornata]